MRKWYEIPALGVSLGDWIAEINARDGEFRWITYLIATRDSSPIGFCQYYRYEDSTEEDFGTLPIYGSYGIDYMIGEEAYLGRGFGKGLITLLADTTFSLPGAKRITADIDAANTASKHALLSCGFGSVPITLDMV